MSIWKNGFALSVCAASLLIASQVSAIAQTDQTSSDNSPEWKILSEQANNQKLFTFDYGIPASPALSLAGLDASQIKPATSLKPFVLSLPGLIDGSSGATSAALDMSPAYIFGEDTKPWTYADPDNYWNRVLTRARFGVALYKGDDGAGDPANVKASRIAVGLSFGFSDDSDPLTANTDHRFLSDGDSVWYSCLKAHKEDLRPFVSNDPFLKAAQADLVTIGDLKDDNGNVPATLSSQQNTDVRDVENRIYKNDNLSAEDATTQKAGRDKMSVSDRLEADRAALVAQRTRLEGTSREEADKLSQGILDNCKKDSSAAADHGADLQLGAGVVWSGDPGTWNNFVDPNAAVWLAGRYPLGTVKGDDCTDKDQRLLSERLFSCWMIGGTGRYSADEMVGTGDTTTPLFKANVAEGWLGVERVDAHSKFGGYVGYTDQSAVNDTDKAFSSSGVRWLVSGAYNVSSIYDGLWVVGSYGAANGTVTTLDDKVAMLTLTFSPPAIGSTFSK